MITLNRERKRIEWERADLHPMSRVLGAEAAMQRWAPPLSSVLKLAKRHGMLMDKAAQMELLAATEWRKHCRALQQKLGLAPRASGKVQTDDVTIPDKHAAKYFPHQRADLHYIYETKLPSYLLAHEPGVGKTLVAIRAAEHWRADRILVVTPNAAKDQWRDEVVRWRDRKLPIRIVEGTTKEQSHTITSMRTGWALTHWESLVHTRDALLEAPWDLVILDEAHNIQNRNAQRTETAFALEKTHGLALTAHPFSNAVDELWPILHFLYPALYRGFWRWAYQHINIVPKPFGGLDMTAPRRPKLLAWEVLPFTMRRAKKDVWKDLPTVVRLRRVVELTPRGRKEYEKLKHQFFVELRAHAGEKRILAIPSVLARLMRLRQYLIDPGILGAKEPSVKYREVLNVLDEWQKPVIVFTVFREAALRLQAFLQKHRKRVDVIVGGQQRRVKPIKKKFLRGQLDAVIIMVKVGGSALNFGKYGYYIDLDIPWNPRDMEQTEGRVDRPEEGTGKMVATTGLRIIVRDSFEERMEDKIVEKKVDFTRVFTINTIAEIFGDDTEE